jgi:tetratricopeptide (TPR) repeat protein
MAYIYSGELRKGLTELHKVSETLRTAQVCEQMGFAYCSLNEPDRAVPYYERAIALDPESQRLRENFARALVLDANAHLEVGERAKAIDLLRRALAQSVDGEAQREIERVLGQVSSEDEAPSAKH